MNQLIQKYSPYKENQYSLNIISYDAIGNVVNEKTSIDFVTIDGEASEYIEVVTSYNKDNQVDQINDRENRQQKFIYDAEGRLDHTIVKQNDTEESMTKYFYDHRNLMTGKKVFVSSSNLIDGEANEMSEILTEFAYDKNGNIIKETIVNDKVIEYTFNHNNQMSSSSMVTTDENNEQIIAHTEISYEWNGEAKTSTDALNNLTEFSYDIRGRLVKIIDANYGTTNMVLDRSGRKIIEVSPVNYVQNASFDDMVRKAYTYDSMNQLTHIYDIYDIDDSGVLSQILFKEFVYDANGNVETEKDTLNNITTYTYYDNNLLKTTLTPEAKIKGAVYSTHIEYDALGRKIIEIDALERITRYKYNDVGQLESVIAVDVQGQEHMLSSNEYDLSGNLIEVTDGENNTIVYEYNELNELVKTTLPEDETIDKLIIEHFYDKFGNLRRESYSDGKLVEYQYDNRGNLTIKIISESDGSNEQIESYTYDIGNNIKSLTDVFGTKRTYEYDRLNQLELTSIYVNGKQQVTTNHYDKNGNLLKVIDWLGNETKYFYDSLNRLEEVFYNDIRIEKYVYNVLHQQVKSIDALDNTTEFVYDQDGRHLTTKTEEGKVTKNTYNIVGNLESEEDGKHNLTTYEYNYLNRLEKVINAKDEETTYTYDNNGNMLTQKDGEQNVTTYIYNVRGLIKEQYDHNGMNLDEKTVSFKYFADGQLHSMRDRNGETTTYNYDIHDRLLSKLVDGEGIEYSYIDDEHKEVMVDLTGTTTRVFDELGRTISKDISDIGESIYNYDEIDSVSEGQYYELTKDPKDNVIKRIFDGLGRLINVIDNGEITTYSYYDNGTREFLLYPDGAKEVYEYDGDNQLLNLKNYDNSSNIIDEYSYTYDDAGNQLSKTESNRGTTDFDYDELNRLETVTESSGKVTTYTYDKAGNRETESINDNSVTLSTYDYNEQNRLNFTITKVDGSITEKTDYSYDNNGNQLFTTVTLYEGENPTSTQVTMTNSYDKYNQLIKSVTQDGTVINNDYNGDGYRVEKSTDDFVTRYIYEGTKIVLELNSLNEEIARNVYGINLLKREVSEETGDSSFYYMYNGHADVVMLIDVETNDIIATYYYDPFGVLLESTVDVSNSITYSGYQYDEETGTYYLNARMYDPRNARFLQEDTYRGQQLDSLSLNLYTYCHNEPNMYYDPSGHMDYPSQLDDLYLGFMFRGYEITEEMMIGGPELQDGFRMWRSMYDTYNYLNENDLSLDLFKDFLGQAIESQFQDDTSFVLDHLHYFDPEVEITDDEVKKLGSSLAGSAEEFYNFYELYGGMIGVLDEFEMFVKSINSMDLYSYYDDIANYWNYGDTADASDLGEFLETSYVKSSEVPSFSEEIADGLKNADIQYKKNPITGELEPYLKQYQIDDTYKAVIRKDVDIFNHGDANHWNLEIRTVKDNPVYDLHIYVDDDLNILNLGEYIPKKYRK